MPRHNPGPALKIRYRMPGKAFRTKLTLSGSISNPPSTEIMGVRKVSIEEIDKVGEYRHPFRDNDSESLRLRKLVRAKCSVVR